MKHPRWCRLAVTYKHGRITYGGIGRVVARNVRCEEILDAAYKVFFRGRALKIEVTILELPPGETDPTFAERVPLWHWVKR